MNENLNLVRILKDCPKGTKLYSTTFGDVELVRVRKNEEYVFPIEVERSDGMPASFTKNGEFYLEYSGEFILFPSKDQRDWSKFSAPWLEKQGKEGYALKSFKDEDVLKFMQYIEKQAKAYEFNLPNRGYDIYAFAKDLLVWIEKQGEDKDKLIQELGEYKIKYTQEVLEKYLNSMSNKDNERLRKTAIAFLKDFAEQGYENAVECIDWLEKQGEDKEEINNFDVRPGLYKCVHRMFDGTPDGKLLFEIGNVYKCISKHDRAEFEVSYGHSIYLEDPVVRKHFIPFESKNEQASSQPNERAWLHLVSDVLTWKDGIGQYLDDPRVQELTKILCGEYAQKLYNPSVLSNSSNTRKNGQKFDPKTLKPFDKVLVWDSKGEFWCCDLFSNIKKGETDYPYLCVGGTFEYCIPYNDETKHLVDVMDDAPEYYRYWED